LLYFLQLGTFGFGGPIVLAAHMERDLVHERRWITAEDFSEGFALAQLAPGPLAAQLAIYLGWVRAGIAGATLVGLVFIAPSFLMVVVLAALYVRFGGIPRGGRRHCGRGDRARPARADRRAHRPHLSRRARAPRGVQAQGPRTGVDPRRGAHRRRAEDQTLGGHVCGG
jgi:hypothetical protein